MIVPKSIPKIPLFQDVTHRLRIEFLLKILFSIFHMKLKTSMIGYYIIPVNHCSLQNSKIFQ